MPDEHYTTQKSLLTKIAQVTADKTAHWYDEGTDRMKSKRPSISLKMALNNYDWQGATINLTVTQKMLKDILRQLKNHEESFVTEKAWATNPHHEYKMWISEYSGDMSIHVNFKFYSAQNFMNITVVCLRGITDTTPHYNIFHRAGVFGAKTPAP